MEIKEVKNDPWLMTHDAFDIYKQCMYKATFSEYTEEIMHIAKKADCHIFACVESGKNKGILILKSVENKTAEILGIAVVKSSQRNGIGKFMLISTAQYLNVKKLTAETDDEAVGFYEHIGFITKPFVRHFSDGDDERYQCHLSI